MKEELLESMQKGAFSMRILYEQFANIQKMGPVGQIMGMIPGLSNMKVCPTIHASTGVRLASERALVIRVAFRQCWQVCCATCCLISMSQTMGRIPVVLTRLPVFPPLLLPFGPLLPNPTPAQAVECL